MTGNHDFVWQEEICDRYDRPYGSSFTVNKDKLTSAIEKYGIDTEDKYGITLFQIIVGRVYFSFDEIDIILSFKPCLIYQYPSTGETVVRYGEWICSRSGTRLLSKLLDCDVNFFYNQYPLYHDDKRYSNLLEYASCLTWNVSNRQSWKCFDLLKNHMNKWISLFDLMKDELEENNKKQPFY